MSESIPKPPLELQVNLDAAHVRFQIQIQRLLEIMTYCFSGQDLVNESNYGTYDRFLKILNPNSKPDLNKAKAESESWLACRFLIDLVNLAGVFLDDIRINCGLLCLMKNRPFKKGALDNLVENEKWKFHRLGIPDKIVFLKNEFDVESALTSHLLSLNRARNCLEHRQGIVSEKDAPNANEMTLKWRTLIFLAKYKNGKEVIIDKAGYTFEEEGDFCIRADDVTKVFKLGEKISLSHEDLFSSVHTLLGLSSTFRESVINYGKSFGVL